MSSISVNYVIQGDDPNEMETVDVGNGNGNIAALKRLIKEQKKLDHLVASKLRLWQVNFALDDPELQNFACNGQPLSPVKKLTIFANGNEEHVHVIVKLPSLEPVELWLNCFILGQHSSFTVKLPIVNSNVSILKADILQRKARALGNIDSDDDLKLWRVHVPVDELSSIECPNEEALPNSMLLSEQFWPVLDNKFVHVVVQVLAEPGSRAIAGGGMRNTVAGLEETFETTCKNIAKALAPSDSAKSSTYPEAQLAYSIHDGRYRANAPRWSVGPPIELFHPAFGHFLDDLRSNGDIPKDTIRYTTTYMRQASGNYDDELCRRRTLTPILSSILGGFNIQTIENDDRTKPDGIVEGSTPHGVFFYLLKEDKNELGDGGSDPSTQAGLSAARTWVQPRLETFRKATSCPTFLIANGGPWFVVLGFALTDRVIVQRLTDFIWVGIDSTLSRAHVNRVARIFYALKTSLDKLKSYYVNHTIDSLKPAPTRYFPSITTYGKGPRQCVRFKYLGYLESSFDCVTLHAKTDTKPTRDIVVKFVERYSERAHRILAKARLAPQLLYYGPVHCDPKQPSYNSLYMVVMEYIDGFTYASAKLAMTKARRATVRSELDRALRLLHENGLVFGDLRAPNVMITKQKEQVMLIDFDWAGEAGQVQYPHLLSSVIEWPQDVQALDPIKKEHDLEMLEKLFD